VCFWFGFWFVQGEVSQGECVLHPRAFPFKGDVSVRASAIPGSNPRTATQLALRLMATLVPDSDIKTMMKRVPEWETDQKSIERTFEFDDFAQAIDFVNAVAEIAEEEDHHPDIDVRWNKVRLILSTHSEGGLTELDFQLAKKIDTLAE